MVATITADDIVKARKYPTLSWPEYSNLPPMGQPADILRGPSSARVIYVRWSPIMDAFAGNPSSP